MHVNESSFVEESGFWWDGKVDNKVLSRIFENIIFNYRRNHHYLLLTMTLMCSRGSFSMQLFQFLFHGTYCGRHLCSRLAFLHPRRKLMEALLFPRYVLSIGLCTPLNPSMLIHFKSRRLHVHPKHEMQFKSNYQTHRSRFSSHSVRIMYNFN